jgi:hypothetical protein
MQGEHQREHIEARLNIVVTLVRMRPAHPQVWSSGLYTDDLDIILAAVHAWCVWWGEVWEAGRCGQDAWVEFWVRTSLSIVSISSLKRRLATWAADGSIAGAKPAKRALRSDIGCSGMSATVMNVR